MKGWSWVKRIGAAGLCASLLAGVTIGFAPASAMDGGSAAEPLSGHWEAASCYAQNAGLDNCLAISDVYIPASTPFSFEAEVFVEKGAAGALAFAVTADGSGYSCVNVDKSSKLAHVFGSFGSFDKALSEEQQRRGSCHLKVELDAAMNLSYSIDGEVIGSIRTSSGAAGYLGLNTYYADVLFENAIYTLRGETKPVTGLSGHTGNWSKAYTGSNRDEENCIALGRVHVAAGQAFSYEGSVRISDGLAASLVFGTAKDGSGLSGACVDKGSGLAHVFGPYGSFSKPLTEEQKAAESYRLKLVYDGKVLSYYLDDAPIGSLNDVTVEGYLGLCTYHAKASFFGIRRSLDEGEEPPVPPALPEEELIPVTGWTEASGNWTVSDESIRADNTGLDNCILLSGIRIPARTGFLYEADVTVEAGSAGALVFGYQNENGWCAASYDISSRLAHVFGGYAVFSRPLTAEQLAVSTHRLKLYLDPSMTLTYYVDDVLVGSAELASFDGGYLGLNTYHSAAVFSNIRYTTLEAPHLTGLSFAEGAFQEPFSPNRTSYAAVVGPDVGTLHLTAEAEDGIDLIVNGALAESGKPVPVTLNGDETEILLTVTDKKGRTCTMTIHVLRVDPHTLYRDTHRPQLHFTARKNWINDPNGLVYDAATGLYHLYYQYSHSVTAGDRTSWGHASSPDLVHWTELPVAIQPDSLGLIWSGSCVIDRDNTSGLFDETTPPDSRIVALYSYDRQNQALAFSTDGGISFTKYADNPVIPNPDRLYGADFRDPKVIWIEDDQQENGGIWLMVVGCSPYRLFTSPDLIHWTYNSDVQTRNGSPFGGECPDVFPLALDGDEDDVKWVICAAGRQYIVGDLVREDGMYTFRAQSDVLAPLNGNSDTVYASQTFYNDPKGRRILVSWLRDSTASVYEDKNWNGALSIPYELKLRTVGGAMQLLTYPVEELNSLRSPEPVWELADAAVSPGDANVLDGVEGSVFDLEAVIRLEDADGFAFRVREAEGEYTAVAYNAQTGRLTVGVNRDGTESAGSSIRLTPTEDGRVRIRILLDNSLVDVFGNGGEAAVTSFLFPEKDGRALSFAAEGGTAVIESLRLYELDSAWNNGYDTSIKTPPVKPAGPSVPSSDASESSPNPGTGRRNLLLAAFGAAMAGLGVIIRFRRPRKA